MSVAYLKRVCEGRGGSLKQVLSKIRDEVSEIPPLTVTMQTLTAKERKRFRRETYDNITDFSVTFTPRASSVEVRRQYDDYYIFEYICDITINSMSVVRDDPKNELRLFLFFDTVYVQQDSPFTTVFEGSPTLWRLSGEDGYQFIVSSYAQGRQLVITLPNVSQTDLDIVLAGGER